MSYFSALAVVLPPETIRASGGPAAGALTAAVLVAVLLWAVILCWCAQPARRSAEGLAGTCMLVIERSPLVTHLALSDREQPATTRNTPGQDRGEPTRGWCRPFQLHQAERAILRQAGFTPVQIDRLLRYRRAYRAGHFHPDPSAPARLHFARWLYQHAKISG